MLKNVMLFFGPTFLSILSFLSVTASTNSLGYSNECSLEIYVTEHEYVELSNGSTRFPDPQRRCQRRGFPIYDYSPTPMIFWNDCNPNRVYDPTDNSDHWFVPNVADRIPAAFKTENYPWDTRTNSRVLGVPAFYTTMPEVLAETPQNPYGAVKCTEFEPSNITLKIPCFCIEWVSPH